MKPNKPLICASLKPLALGLFVITAMGCGAGVNKTNVELIQDMMETKAQKAQGFYQSDRDRGSMREPVQGTVPRGFTPYKYANDPVAAEKNLKNPLAGDLSPETLETGRKYFEIHCAICHGVGGHGDGNVAKKMLLPPPPLVSDKVKNYLDGRIFHIITVGQGLMGRYSDSIVKPEERWAVVNYVRYLQKSDAKAGGH